MDRNYNITTKVCGVLNDIKGFEVAMNNPKKGKLIAKYEGVSFCVSIEPLFNDNEAGRAADSKPFEEIVKDHAYIFR